MVRRLASPELTPDRPVIARTLRAIAAAAGLGLVALPFTGAAVPLAGEAPVLVGAAGIATLLLAVGIQSGFRASAAWAGLTVLGQASALQLVRAGPVVSYQHYALPPDFGSPAVQLSLAAVGAQTLLVMGLAVRHRRAIRERLLGDLGGWELALGAAVFVLTSATLSPTVPAYLSELAVAGLLQAVNAATITVAVVRLPESTLDRIGGRADRWTSKEESGGGGRLLPAGAALWAVAVTVVLVVAVYQRHPHIPDEVVYLLHARYLAEGQLSMPVPPVPEAFQLDLMFLDGGRWYSPVPPGWPAVLAAGVAAGAPWLVNPLLAGASVLLTHRLLRHLYGERTASIGTLLLALSPWYLFLGMSLMNHTVILAAALGGAVAVTRLTETRKLRWAALGGMGAGIVALVRPLDGLLVGGILGAWCLTIPGRRWRLAPALAFGIAAVLVAGLVLPYNEYFTGDPTAFPIMEYTSTHYGEGANALGFGPDRGLGWGGFDPFPGHDLKDAVINTDLNAFALNIELFGWSAGSLLPILVLVASRRLQRTDVALLGVVALVVAVYGLYWFSGGPDFGPRYWSLILVPGVALTARGVPAIGRLLRPVEQDPSGANRLRSARRSLARGTAAVGLAALAVMTTFIPWRAVDKYRHYRGMQPEIRAIAQEREFGQALILIRGQRWPDYESAAVYNPLDLRAPRPVYAWDRGPDVRAKLLRAYPHRTVWIVEGPTRTGDGYRVVGRLRHGDGKQ